MSLDRLILASKLLGRAFARRTQPGENVGLLLPNVTGVAASSVDFVKLGQVQQILEAKAGGHRHTVRVDILFQVSLCLEVERLSS